MFDSGTITHVSKIETRYSTMTFDPPISVTLANSIIHALDAYECDVYHESLQKHDYDASCNRE